MGGVGYEICRYNGFQSLNSSSSYNYINCISSFSGYTYFCGCVYGNEYVYMITSGNSLILKILSGGNNINFATSNFQM